MLSAIISIQINLFALCVFIRFKNVLVLYSKGRNRKLPCSKREQPANCQIRSATRQISFANVHVQLRRSHGPYHSVGPEQILCSRPCDWRYTKQLLSTVFESPVSGARLAHLAPIRERKCRKRKGLQEVRENRRHASSTRMLHQAPIFIMYASTIVTLLVTSTIWKLSKKFK